MCKVLAFTNTKKLDLKKSVNAIGNIMLALEKDGFGYAVQGPSNVFGEKCVAKQFQSRQYSRYEVRLPVVKKTHERFGSMEPCAGPGIFHGRTSTNVKGLLNCHPMQREDENGGWHLIHNGVVTDHGPKYSKNTQNDSEDVLHRLMHGIEQVEAHLEGYYAFAAIDPQGRLHIGRDNIANLHMAWSQTLETFIIGTTVDLIKSVAKQLKAKIGPIDEINDNVYMIFDGNDVVYHRTISPRGYSSSQSRWASKSLGREISPGVYDATGTPSLYGWHHRNRPESSWENASTKTADTVTDDKEIEKMHADASEATVSHYDEDEEKAYYAMKSEIDSMDAAYQVYDANGAPITILEFRKMDYISQELCTVIRPDGTVIELDDFKFSREKRMA